MSGPSSTTRPDGITSYTSTSAASPPPSSEPAARPRLSVEWGVTAGVWIALLSLVTLSVTDYWSATRSLEPASTTTRCPCASARSSSLGSARSSGVLRR